MFLFQGTYDMGRDKAECIRTQVLVRDGTSRRFDLILGIVILGESLFPIEFGLTALSQEHLFNL